jgi:dihydrofolate reductase
MTKVVAIMSMSLDGYVADANDGVDEVFDWYFSGDVEIPMPSATSDMTFRVSPPSADHVTGLMAEVGAMLTGRRTFDRAGGWGGQHPWDVPAFVVIHNVPDGWPRPGCAPRPGCSRGRSSPSRTMSMSRANVNPSAS